MLWNGANWRAPSLFLSVLSAPDDNFFHSKSFFSVDNFYFDGLMYGRAVAIVCARVRVLFMYKTIFLA